MLRFGAEFDGKLTLLSFRVRQERRQEVTLDFQWHAPEICSGWTVFVHFLDDRGDIRFQGDHPLSDHKPDPLGFIYYCKRVAAPEGKYRVRVGVWRPAERLHLRLTRFRGCIQEAPGWCQNAVLLDGHELT